MAKRILIAMMVLLMAVSGAAAKEIGGKNLPESITAGKDTLVLNGAGVRVKWFMDIYAGGLYLKQKNQDPQAIINADEPMAIKMHTISGLMSDEKMETAYREGFEKALNGNTAPIQAKIEKFIAAHKGEINKDDVFDLVYVPGEGVSVYKNGRMITTIEGMDFKKPMFAIWLGEEPADSGLKTGMLGK